MVNYQQSKIYRISSAIGGLTYYGSTADILSKRMGGHRKDYKRYLAGKSNNVTSFQVLAFEDAEIILVELFPCDSKIELHSRERYWIENNDCVNKVVPGRGRTERSSNYYINNKDKIHEYKNEKFNCECGGKYSKANKSIHLQSIKHRRYLENQLPEYTA